MRPFTLCNSSFTPGLLNPAFKPLGLNTGLESPPGAVVAGGGVFGFFWLIGASAFNYTCVILFFIL
jgi:hypothetical protein